MKISVPGLLTFVQLDSYEISLNADEVDEKEIMSAVQMGLERVKKRQAEAKEEVRRAKPFTDVLVIIESRMYREYLHNARNRRQKDRKWSMLRTAL